MNDASTLYVLLTHFGTLLCVDPDTGELVHHAPDRDTINLVFNKTPIGYRIDESFSSGIEALSRADPQYPSWDVGVKSSSGQVTLRKDGQFACAGFERRVTFSRPVARAWEWFTPSPLMEVYRKVMTLHQAPTLRPRRRVPKILHQVYISDREGLPDDLVQNTQMLRKANTDHDYHLWNGESVFDFIHDEYGIKMLHEFLKINPAYGACRADFFRYLCVYKKGGVYLDIKSNVSRPLSQIVKEDDPFILAQWDNSETGKWRRFGLHPELSHISGGEFQQWHVISAPGHPFLERVINKVLFNIASYNPARDGVGRKGVLRLAGPIAYTNAISNALSQHPYTRIDAESAGLIYKAIQKHKGIFTSHYSYLDTPIIQSS